jgi:hypothetical protein
MDTYVGVWTFDALAEDADQYLHGIRVLEHLDEL